MFDRLSAPPSSSGPLQRLLSGVLGFFVVAMGMLLVLGAVILGLFMATGVVLWALLRGRRPPAVNLHWGQRVPRSAGFGRPAGTAAGEVVDVQVRELQDEPGQRR